MDARRYRVTGNVQGVWFRGACQERARHLGLTGWVANRPDGSVEIVAEGPAGDLRRFETFLQDEPGQSSVKQLMIEVLPVSDAFRDFTIQ